MKNLCVLLFISVVVFGCKNSNNPNPDQKQSESDNKRVVRPPISTFPKPPKPKTTPRIRVRPPIRGIH